MNVNIHEKQPNGAASIAAIKKKLQGIVYITDDIKSYHAILKREAQKAFRYTFSDANPNHWTAISPTWAEFKASKGYPTTIGIMTGALKTAFTDAARVESDRNRFRYQFDKSVVNPYSGPGMFSSFGKGGAKTVGEYAESFDARRPIMNYAESYMQSVLNQALSETIREAVGKRWAD